MILNDTYTNRLALFSQLISTLPYYNHLRLSHVHNIEFRYAWSLPVRIIDEFILVYIRSGNGHYTIEDEIIPFESGHVFVISPGTEFSAVGYEETPSLLSIRFNLFSNTTAAITPPPKPFYLHHNTRKNIEYRTQFYEVYSVFLRGRSPVSENAILSLLLNRLLVDLEQSSSSTDFDLRLESARVYIEKNPSLEIDITALARLSHLSPPYFSKKFKKHYGLTPKSYIYNTKMQHAKTLLTNYHYSVKETANALHYSDMFIFSNQYKKFWGHSPSRARKL